MVSIDLDLRWGIRQGCGLLSHHEGSAEETNKDQNKPTPWRNNAPRKHAYLNIVMQIDCL